MLRHVIQAFDLLSDAKITGEKVVEAIKEMGLRTIEVITIEEIVKTQFIKAQVSGKNGKSTGGMAPTLGIIGGLGGIGVRPKYLGLVSDADGAISAISVLLKLIFMQKCGDYIEGDIIVSTHICPNAPIIHHDPVLFVGNPTEKSLTKMENSVDSRMDAILHIETSRGNRVINFRGFAITPTIKECYILKVSNDILNIMQNVTGQMPQVVPITTQDVTPIDNGLYHMNGLGQETVISDSPVVGVALTSVVPVPGCATGANQIMDIEVASRFVIEVAKAYTAGECKFYDEEEFEKLIKLYGSMKHLRKM